MRPSCHKTLTKSLLLEGFSDAKVIVHETLSGDYCDDDDYDELAPQENQERQSSRFREIIRSTVLFKDLDADVLDNNGLACGPSAQAAHPQGCCLPHS